MKRRGDLEFGKLSPSEQFPPLNDSFNSTMFRYLANHEVARFSVACKQTYSWAYNELENRKATSALLLSVLQGNATEAIERTINPNLFLSTKGVAKDYFNRRIQDLSPFQAALCAGDVEMCEMMKRYIVRLENGQVELEKQFNDVFPKGLEAHVQIKQDNVFDFSEILQAIIQAPDIEVTAALHKVFDNNLPLHLDLEKFRNAFTEKSFLETVFNPYHLLRAFQTYYQRFDDLVSMDKRNLFWRQIIGFVQRHLPACYLQALAQGTFYIVGENEALRRLFQFRSDNNICIVPFQVNSGLGFDWAVGCGGKAQLRGFVGQDMAMFSKLCGEKISGLQNLRIPVLQTRVRLAVS